MCPGDDDHEPPPVPCPACEGQGFDYVEEYIGVDYRDGSVLTHTYKQGCFLCDGTGWIDHQPVDLEELQDLDAQDHNIVQLDAYRLTR